MKVYQFLSNCATNRSDRSVPLVCKQNSADDLRSKTTTNEPKVQK